MAETEQTQASNNETATDVSDRGVEFGGGGGVMDWSWIGDMVDAGIQTQHDVAEQRQRARGADPCVYFASIDEIWATNHGPAWWMATTTAAKVAEKLDRAITESIRRRGRASQAASQSPLEDFLVDQLGADELVPPAIITWMVIQGFLTSGASVAQAPAAVLAYIKDHLPRGSDILAGTVSGAEKGLEVGPGIYMWAPGLPTRPQGEADNRRLREQGRYMGPTIVAQLAEWTTVQRERVVPNGFLSARGKLTNLTGGWEGSGNYGIWVPSDGYAPGSRIGFLEDWRETFWAERAEAKALCRQWGEREQERADVAAGMPGYLATIEAEAAAQRNRYLLVLGLAATAAWAFGR